MGIRIPTGFQRNESNLSSKTIDIRNWYVEPEKIKKSAYIQHAFVHQQAGADKPLRRPPLLKIELLPSLGYCIATRGGFLGGRVAQNHPCFVWAGTPTIRRWGCRG
jgi:hypothetical protein